MLFEHGHGRELLAAIRDAGARASGSPGERTRFAAAARAYADLLAAHIDKENQVLFRMADQAISGEDQRRVDEAFDAFEEEHAPRRSLFERGLAQLAQELL
jgi:hemerythrin-like domain-containing protein